jgi:hypothetical protein
VLNTDRFQIRRHDFETFLFVLETSRTHLESVTHLLCIAVSVSEMVMVTLVFCLSARCGGDVRRRMNLSMAELYVGLQSVSEHGLCLYLLVHFRNRLPCQ